MRLGTTAAVLVGAVALVLPTAGPSLADGHDGWNLGVLHYRFLDEAGEERDGQIRPQENDTCYVLTHTSRDEPAIDVRNDTESLAVLFDNRGCNGEAEVVLEPGERVRNVEVVSAFFKPVGEGGNGHHDWNGGNGGGNGGGDGDGRGDWNGGGGDEDFFGSGFGTFR
ncbi:hypothetical protein OG625_11845 [Streptomyces sp. NBC_01351]|uniref:hypothetical protein n=1 Tax=Streptomyces sp. NBC_01351 TaxID=2903833 RepID=UPI002E37436B|nr:hypothetical protein [Streptomyces sp. NBC_01351]